MEARVTGFWIGVVIVFLIIVGGSVLVGKMLSKPRGEGSSQPDRMTALKASGALKHRKSNRN